MVLLAGLATVTSHYVVAESRWYQVEVIVFNHNDRAAAASEQWPGLESLPDFRNAINLFIDRPDPHAGSGAERPNEVMIPGLLAFQSLPARDLQLGGVYRRLQDLNAYSPILHIGWRQPGSGDNRARSVYISDKPRIIIDGTAGPDTAPKATVEGVIQIRIGRLLHVETDVVWYGDDAPVRIKEQRQVKLQELHYFDHPRFGVIVQVTPYRIADPAVPSADEPSAASNAGE